MLPDELGVYGWTIERKDINGGRTPLFRLFCASSSSKDEMERQKEQMAELEFNGQF